MISVAARSSAASSGVGHDEEEASPAELEPELELLPLPLLPVSSPPNFARRPGRSAAADAASSLWARSAGMTTSRKRASSGIVRSVAVADVRARKPCV